MAVGMVPSAARADVVRDVEDWFNKISTMKANFIQVASDGTVATVPSDAT